MQAHYHRLYLQWFSNSFWLQMAKITVLFLCDTIKHVYMNLPSLKYDFLTNDENVKQTLITNVGGREQRDGMEARLL